VEGTRPPVKETIEFARIVAFTDDFDRRLLVLNLVYLSLIVLIPFPTNLLGEYGSESDAVVLYSLVIGSASLLNSLMLRSALRSDHVAPAMRSAATEMSGGALSAAIVFYASIPVALVSPVAGQLFWLMLVLDGLRQRRSSTRARPARRA
jgi:uncharacterized membrane protein